MVKSDVMEYMEKDRNPDYGTWKEWKCTPWWLVTKSSAKQPKRPARPKPKALPNKAAQSTAFTPAPAMPRNRKAQLAGLDSLKKAATHPETTP
jgi:hypothetical protein